MSVGNQFIEIDLLRSKTTLISGANGTSKSTFIEAIVFALYGKPFRKINKPQLINSINQKELLVELEFSIAADKYLIRRGMKPNIFEIWKNNDLVNKDAAIRDYQEYLEQNIIKMSFKSFSQIVILGSATYVPFMELPAGQRREIIEDLLDIQVFSTMNILLKEKIADNKTNITDNNYSIDLLKTRIEAAKEHNEEIQRIKETEVEKIKGKIEENLNTIEIEKQVIEKLETEITELSTLITDKAKQKKTLEQAKNLLYELTSKYKSHIDEISFYSNHDNCPTCKQGIEHVFKEHIVSEKTDKNTELLGGIDQLKTRIETVESRLNEISDIEDQIQKLHNTANEHRLQVKITIGQLKSFKKELESAEREVEEIDQTKIFEFMNDLKSKQDEQTELYENRETLGIVGTMLKDGGIKTSIIKTYIPIMNKLINQFLSEFELFVDFNLDENFNETIKSRFRDAFSFASFSEGEKMRISLSIMFTWRAIAKLRNSVSTNLLIMDEVFDSSLDSSGTEEFLKILETLTQDTNTFIISHKGDQLFDRFHSIIKFEKHSNFSRIAA
jgi:DNA repair exonuclease SbcCD ATPase subunit